GAPGEALLPARPDGPRRPHPGAPPEAGQLPALRALAARNNTATKRARQPIRLPRLPNYYYEQQAWASGHHLVAGVDEAGRGAWAGPIVAAAVMLPVEPERRAALSRALTRFGISVNDSKKLLPEQ